VIVRDVFLGKRRFHELQESLGIARNVLAGRLGRLVDEGILERVPYSERPVRHEYRVTPKGIELNVALTALRQWGDKYLSDAPPRLLRTRSDRKPVVAALVPKGAKVLGWSDVETVPGPGATRAR
jgi:DNA-binding HxlR family transcriptional regulator